MTTRDEDAGEPSLAEPTPLLSVRRLMRSSDRAALSTAQRDGDGWPYGSLVLVASDTDAAPLLLISTLADHTKNLLEDDRASLLFDGTGGLDDPLTGARATVMGRMQRIAEGPDLDRARRRFVSRHPSAEMYVGFGDFAFWRLEPARAHLVAGFGKIHWIDGAGLLGQKGLPLDARESDVVEHMNEDHADAIDLYARVLLRLEGEGWHMTGCDPDGIDLRLAGRVARLDFDSPVEDAEGARRALVVLVKRARAMAAASGDQ